MKKVTFNVALIPSTQDMPLTIELNSFYYILTILYIK